MKGLFTGLRGRLLVGFILVSVPPLLLFAVAVSTLVSRSFEAAARERQASGLRTVRDRIESMRRRAEAQVAAIAALDLPAAASSGSAERSLADEIARRRDLAALEIVDRQGRVISSHHWPAGFALQEQDELFPGDPALRIEKVADGYGAVDRLALLPEKPAVWRGAEVVVRGGPFLDGDLLADLSRLMGAEVGFYDKVRGRWIAAAGSPLARASVAPPDPTRPSRPASLDGSPYRWSAAPLNPSLLLVLATPTEPLEAVTRDLRRLSLLLALTSLAGALIGALVVSARLSRPIRELAAGALQVAQGDLDLTVPVRGSDEIAELARTFNAMTRELKASGERLVQAERVAAWREIAQRLAHELKKPLFPIQLSLETLRRSAERSPADAGFAALARESTDTMLDELTSLRGIIEEFSQFARMPHPHLRPTDLNEVATQALSLYRERAAHVTIETELAAGLPPAAADPDLLGRALGNLVANALEAMPAGGALRLRTFARDASVGVAVQDTGPGLTEEQRRRLFTPYYTTKEGGTGLGLAIVQGIVSDQGGRVEVGNAPEGGTIFTLILPAAAPENDATETRRHGENRTSS